MSIQSKFLRGKKKNRKNHKWLQTLQLLYREISLKMLSTCQCFFMATEYVADLAYLELQELLDNTPYKKFFFKTLQLNKKRKNLSRFNSESVKEKNSSFLTKKACSKEVDSNRWKVLSKRSSKPLSIRS